MKTRYRVALAAIVILTALAFFCIGFKRVHRAYEVTEDEFGIKPWHPVSERQLIVDSTFGGVAYKDGKLYTTYNRLAAGGKRACPT